MPRRSLRSSTTLPSSVASTSTTRASPPPPSTTCANERLARDPLRHLPAGGIGRPLLFVVLGIRVDQPRIVMRAHRDVPRDQDPRHHRVVLVVVVMHPIPADEPQV